MDLPEAYTRKTGIFTLANAPKIPGMLRVKVTIQPFGDEEFVMYAPAEVVGMTNGQWSLSDAAQYVDAKTKLYIDSFSLM